MTGMFLNLFEINFFYFYFFSMKFTTRNLAAYFVAEFLLKFGFVRKAIQNVLNEQVIISIFCHDPSKKFFEANIKWLKKAGFAFISMEDLQAISLNNKSFPQGAVIVTVDDGWVGNKENIVSIAHKYQIPITIFVSTDPVYKGDAYWWSYITEAIKKGLTKYSLQELKSVEDSIRVNEVESVKLKLPMQRESLTIQDIQELGDSSFITIQSHTVSHPILTNCTNKKAMYEIRESKRLIETWTNKPVFSFSYPNGNFSKREMQYLDDAGYQLAFTTRDNYITPKNISEKFTLPRVDLIENISFSENICRLTGVWFEKRDWLNKIFN